MRAHFSIAAFASLVLGACVNEQLRPELVSQLGLSASDVREIRKVLMRRPDIRKPLWGFYRDEHGRIVAQSGGNRAGDKSIGSFVTLVHRNGQWQIVKIKEGPVMTVVVSSILSGTTEHIGDTPVRPNQSLQPTASPRR